LYCHLHTFHDHTSAIAMATFGIPLTGSMATGFAVGFMKG
jgi:hypothetical protein